MLTAIILIVILIFSVIFHEVAHGYMADYLGDPTPRMQGRLTLNPIKHIDPFGSIIVPIITSFAGFAFGWAKPVVYNPYNIKNKRQGEFLIAAAGPLSNIVLAIIFSILIRVSISNSFFTPESIQIFGYIVLINLVLAIFNLIPVPPLDGSKLFLAFLPNQYGRLRHTLETFGPIFIILVVFVVWQIIYPIVSVVFKLFTGLNI